MKTINLTDLQNKCEENALIRQTFRPINLDARYCREEDRREQVVSDMEDSIEIEEVLE